MNLVLLNSPYTLLHSCTSDEENSRVHHYSDVFQAEKKRKEREQELLNLNKNKCEDYALGGLYNCTLIECGTEKMLLVFDCEGRTRIDILDSCCRALL